MGCKESSAAGSPQAWFQHARENESKKGQKLTQVLSERSRSGSEQNRQRKVVGGGDTMD
jgi:hypothetical protein